MPNLCVSCAFNPPVVTILGATLRDDTIHGLEKRLPLATATAVSPGKEVAKFTYMSNPDHLRLELSQHFCDDLHKSAFFLAIIQTLEEEGWTVRASNSVSHIVSDKETNKMFFTRS